MLILPPGHAQQARASRRFSVRERWMVGIGAALAAVLIAVTVIAVATKGHTSGNGCVDVTIASALGAQEFYHCGARAKSFCIQSGEPGGYTGVARREIATQCRKAGLRFG
jgi:hypothetical protein